MIQYLITQKLLGVLIRHLLGALGAWLIANGWVDDGSWQELMGGSLAALTAIGLSLKEKAMSAKAPPVDASPG